MDNRVLTALDNVIPITFNALRPDTQRVSISSNPREISDTQITWCGYLVHNNDASLVTWLQVFFKRRGDVVLGTTPPDFTVKIGAAESLAWDFLNPIRQGEGLTIAATTTETNSTAPSAGVTGVIFVKNKQGQVVA